MDKSTSKKVIVLALVTIVLCFTLIVAGTLALFSGDISVGTHINAGNLKITCVRTSHSYSIIDEEGFLKTTSVESESKDVKNLGNAFDLPANALIVPGSKLSATFKISNLDMVAFDYSIALIAKDGEGEDLTEVSKLLSQLSIKLTDSVGTNVLQEDATSLEVNGVKTLKAKFGSIVDSESFTVEIEFLDLDDNNSAMSQGLYLDLTISAVQQTTKPAE